MGSTRGLGNLKLVASGTGTGLNIGPPFISKTVFDMACDTRLYLHSLTLSPTDTSRLWQMFAGKPMNPAMAGTYGWRAFTQSMLVMAIDQSASRSVGEEAPGHKKVSSPAAISRGNFSHVLAALEQFHRHHPWPWYLHLACYPKYHVLNSTSAFVDTSTITLLRGSLARYFACCNSGVDLTKVLLDRYAPHSTALLPPSVNVDKMGTER